MKEKVEAELSDVQMEETQPKHHHDVLKQSLEDQMALDTKVRMLACVLDTKDMGDAEMDIVTQVMNELVVMTNAKISIGNDAETHRMPASEELAEAAFATEANGTASQTTGYINNPFDDPFEPPPQGEQPQNQPVRAMKLEMQPLLSNMSAA